MWLPVAQEQAFQHSPRSKQLGVYTKTMIMDSSNSQHLIILTCYLSTRRAGMEMFTTLSEYPAITGTFWLAQWIAVQVQH